MRIRSFAAALAAVGALSVPALAADAPKGPWDGYGVGTTVTMKQTMKVSMEGAPETSTQSRTTLVKITDAEYTLKMEQEMGGQWMAPMEVPLPRKATAVAGEAPKPEDHGEEKVTVGGESIACKKTKSVVADTTTITWTNEKYGVVKSESSGAGDIKTTMALTNVAKKVTVAGKEVECREQVVTSKGGGFDSTTTMLFCDKIPGSIARSESNSTSSGMTTNVVAEVTAFEVK